MVSEVSVHKKPDNDSSNEVTSHQVIDNDTTSLDRFSDLTAAKLLPRSRTLHHLRRMVLPLALGQFLSVIIAVTGITSNYLVNFGISLPLVQNLPHYVLLAIVFGIFRWVRLPSPSEVYSPSCSHRFLKFLRTRGWQYFIAGTIDVHANWAIVSAYAYTNLTSVQLLDCLSIPTAVVLSRFCLKTRYKWSHITGVLICLVGSGSMVAADYLAAKGAGTNSSASETENSQNTSLVLFGDFLIIIGAIGYGVSNVYEEYLVRKFGIIDYLIFASSTAVFWTAIYCSAVERTAIGDAIASHDPKNLPAIVGCLIGFALSMFVLYCVMPVALSKTNAVLVNLSLLTADVYALVIGIFLFKYVFHPLYIASYVAIMLGVCLFASKDPIFSEIGKTVEEEEEEEDEDDEV
ncbi:hypothetical protein Aperf_G00000121877 [Anoplocephala perfoliata]